MRRLLWQNKIDLCLLSAISIHTYIFLILSLMNELGLQYVEERIKKENSDTHLDLTACITILQFDEFHSSNFMAGRPCIRGLVLFENYIFSFISIYTTTKVPLMCMTYRIRAIRTRGLYTSS